MRNPHLEFWISGTPVAAPRPRAYTMQTPKGPQARMYTGHRHGGDRIKEWMSAVRSSALASVEPLESPLWPRSAPLAVEVIFHLQRPLAHYRGSKSREKPLKPTAPDLHVVTPDADNFVKAVLDGCTSIIWHDDRQIAKLEVVKMYAHGDPGCWVAAKEISPDEAQALRNRHES